MVRRKREGSKKLNQDNDQVRSAIESIQEVVFGLESQRSGIDESVEIDRMAFSSTLGYTNPEAIDFIDFDSIEVKLDEASEWLDKEALAQLAIDQSYEIKQLNHLLKAAADQKKSVDWAFLDPQNGDSRANIGWASKPRAEIGSSRIEELQIAQSEIPGIVRKKVYETVFSYNRAIREQKLEAALIVRAGEHLSRLLDQGIKEQVINQHDLEGAVHAVLSKVFAYHTRLAKYRIARSKIERFQYAGVFQRSAEKYLESIRTHQHINPEHHEN